MDKKTLDNQPLPFPVMAVGDTPNCGNCCNALKSPVRIGYILCTALPPSVMTVQRRPGETPQGQNVRPELEAGKLGCTALWGVNAQVFHALVAGLDVLLRPTSSAGSQDGEETGQPPPRPPAG